ncbi:MAG: ATP-binding protein [Vicingaceae bacterium]
MTTDKDLVEKVKFPSEIKYLNEVQQFVDRICERYNVEIEDYGNILISLTEAVTNAIQHGNQNDPNKTVTIAFQKNNNEFEFTIVDEGKGFDYKNIPDPTSKENLLKPSGRGIFIIKNLCDEICFYENGKKVCIKFVLPCS